MRRVVVTGLGIVSCLGNNAASVATALRNGTSGIRHNPVYAEMGFRSQVCGRPDIDLKENIDRKTLRFMGEAAGWSYIAMQQAIDDAGLEAAEVSNERSGIIAGSGGASSANVVESADILRARGIKRIGPYRVTQTMGSTVSACLATPFKIKGVNYSLSSACATSAHCIGNAAELIQLGKQDIVFAGGGEEEHWSLSCLFDAMGALSTKYNSTPQLASRPYDVDRDGFVISGGAGMVVLEELEHAQARGAHIYAEVTGYGATSDGYDMVAPSGEGAVRCMRQALATVDGPVDYINAHGTSTPAGDMQELKAIRETFSGQALPLVSSTKSLATVDGPVDYINAHGTSTPAGDMQELKAIRETFSGQALPLVSSTKSLAGHSLGATGVQEVIFSLLMMKEGFVAASANIENLDPDADGLNICTTRRDDVALQRIMSNSFGFGGTNATLILEKLA